MQDKMDNNKVIFRYSNKGLIKSIILFLIFTACGILGIYSSNFLLRVFGCIITLFFGIFSLVPLWRLITRSPILIISAIGIYPNSLIFHKQLVPWKDIDRIEKQDNIYRGITGISKRTVLAVYLKDPKKYNFRIIKKETGDLVAEKFKSQNEWKADINIFSALFEKPIDEILTILSKYPVKIKSSTMKVILPPMSFFDKN